MHACLNVAKKYLCAVTPNQQDIAEGKPHCGFSAHSAPSTVPNITLFGMRLLAFLLYSVGFIPLAVSAADEYATTIRQAKVELVNDVYHLNATINYTLSPAAKEALLKGVALSWVIPLILKQQRDYLWNKEILRITLRYQIQYFALLNVYRVKAEHNGQVNNFSSLAAALNSIASIHSLRLIDKAQLQANQSYQVALKVFFNREALPIPLRPVAYVDNQWSLSSDWFICPL